MFIVQTYPQAVLFCILTMICWGSWANTQKLAGRRWRFELFYWDYVLGCVLMSLIFALTLGSSGTQGRSFADDFQQAESAHLLSAFIGGVTFNVANILLVAAIAISGMAVAFPVGIGIALVLGVVVNYFGTGAGVPDSPALLFLGVTLIIAAIILDALAYRRVPNQAQGGLKGLVISVLCGITMAFFYKFVADSMATNSSDMEPGKLSPYTAMVLFSLGLLASNFILNTAIMIKPFAGDPVPLSDYFRGTFNDHLWGIIGGMIWCVGMTFSILAAEKASFAISYGLGQGATLVAAIWGVFVWKEFREAQPGTNRLLALMFLGYVAGLGLIIAAR